MADELVPPTEPTPGAPLGAHPGAAVRALLWETGTDPMSVVATAAELTALDEDLVPDLGAAELLAAAAHLRTCGQCQARTTFELAVLGSSLAAGEGIDPRPIDLAVDAALAAFDPALLPAAARVEQLEPTVDAAPTATRSAARSARRAGGRRSRSAASPVGEPDGGAGGGLLAGRLTWRHMVAAFVIAAAVPLVPAVIRSMRIPPAPQSALPAGTTANTTASTALTSPAAATPMAAQLDVPTSIVAVPAPVDGAAGPSTAVTASPTVPSLFDDAPVGAAEAAPPATAPSARSATTPAAAAVPSGGGAIVPVDLGNLGTFATAADLRSNYWAKAPALRGSVGAARAAATLPAQATLPCLSASGMPVLYGAHALVAGRPAVILQTAYVALDDREAIQHLVVLDAATCSAIA